MLNRRDAKTLRKDKNKREGYLLFFHDSLRKNKKIYSLHLCASAVRKSFEIYPLERAGT
tara:strand:- start:3648 stop:3824 length:177 start_codon:yes stop_codon:yes gene_type:complete